MLTYFILNWKVNVKNIAYNKYKPNRTTRRFHVDSLLETSMLGGFSSNWKNNLES
jgi:hypothetical protein